MKFILIIIIFTGITYSKEMSEPNYQIISNNSQIGVEIFNQISPDGSESFDWSQLPNLGVDKRELQEIKVLRRFAYSNDDRSFVFEPFTWIFISKNWQISYEGQIPYLQNLTFNSLGISYSVDQVTSYTQNTLGYFQDTQNGIPGIYPYINNIMNSSNVITFFKITKQYVTNIIEEVSEDIPETISSEIPTTEQAPRLYYHPAIVTNL